MGLEVFVNFKMEVMELNDVFYQTIRNLVEGARNQVKVAVNFTMVDLYWAIGKQIV